MVTSEERGRDGTTRAEVNTGVEPLNGMSDRYGPNRRLILTEVDTLDSEGGRLDNNLARREGF